MPHRATPAWPLVLEISGQLPSVNQRLCWQARRRLERPFRELVGWQARAQYRGPPLERACVRITFIHRSRRYLNDDDNLFSRCKCLIDSLKNILIVDDSPEHLALTVRQELGRERGVRLKVWPAEVTA